MPSLFLEHLARRVLVFIAVTVANDGDEALRLLRTKRIDVVVTDLRLGAVDGLAVLRAASEQP